MFSFSFILIMGQFLFTSARHNHRPSEYSLLNKPVLVCFSDFCPDSTRCCFRLPRPQVFRYSLLPCVRPFSTPPSLTALTNITWHASKAVLLLWFLIVTGSCCPYLYFASAIMLVAYFINFRQLNDHLFGKELFIRFTASAFRKLVSVYVFSYFLFGFKGRM